MARYKDVFKIMAKAIADEYGITPQEMFANSKRKKLVEARQIFHYLAYKHYNTPLSIIGAFSKTMGRPVGHNHASVLYGHNLIQDRISVDKRYERQISLIENHVLKIIEATDEIKEKRKEESKVIAEKLFLMENKDFINSLQKLISEVTKGNPENDIEALINIQKEVNNGRIRETSPLHTNMGEVLGHTDKSPVYSPTP